MKGSRTRHLVLILGDQLDAGSAAFDGFDARRDAVWMAEASEESTHVWSHKARIALFLAAMRHFRDALHERGWTVHYHTLDAAENPTTLADLVTADLARFRPEKIVMVEAGDWRVQSSLKETAQSAGIELEVRADRHFLCSHDDFAGHATGRKQLRMEYFYREMRRRTGVLMDGDDPEGGKWNYDAKNRGTFGRDGPGEIAEPIAFRPDATTRAVLDLVATRFADHPGELTHFDWPVTRDQALEALDDFIRNRLPQFGRYQDAMWADPDEESDGAQRRHAYLFHSRLSAALNLKLLDPREIIAAAENAYYGGAAPLEAVEGFIRQILGWREYVRGIYGRFMPDYLDLNEFDARLPLPDFYWTGRTEMNCLRHAVGQTLTHGYAHHIQRLMVTGLYALLLGVDPRAVHEWYLAVYVDAVEWVELPNTLGMSQFADGGRMASKPYIASGKYVQRMSNYCGNCRFDPAQSTGATACPFTTLYWDFLLRHEKALAGNPRMTLQLKNLERLDRSERSAIRGQAEAHRRQIESTD